MKTYPLFIARRYLFSREGGPMVMIITAISILGVAIGVAALVAVIAVMDGADEDLFRKMIDVYAHVRIIPEEPRGFANYEELAAAVAAVPGVKAAAPAITRQAIVYQEDEDLSNAVGIIVEGIDMTREVDITGINRNIIAGTGTPGPNEIVLGAQLSWRLRVSIGDTITLFTKISKTVTGKPGFTPKTALLRVAGLLQSGFYDFDNSAAFVSLETARRMFALGDVAEEIRASLDDPFEASKVLPAIKDAVRPLLMGSARIKSWEEDNREFFKALQLEKLGLFVILLLVVIVASFNIIGTQILIVMQKTREIGILMSMGVSRKAIRRIFLGFGLNIGFIGTAVGVLLGFAICLVLANTDLIRLPEAVYGISRLPVKIKPLTVLVIVACSLTICSVAAVFPAWRASRLDPVEALRYE